MAPIVIPNKIDRVAVIGAGPGGLAAAKYLRDEKCFSSIDVFEQRDSVGGIWNATLDETSISENFVLPRTRPSLSPSHPVWKETAQRARFEFVSPVYDQLETNIPHTLMNYSDQAFPRDSSLFPRHQVVLEYLKRYAEDIKPLLKLGTQVLDVKALEDSGKWSVTTKPIQGQEVNTSIYDAVVVASGHYDDPYIPSIPGMKEWNIRYPGAISHSKFYRRPNAYKNKKVIIVGYSASGIDLSAQISTVSQVPLIISEKKELPLSPNDSNVTEVYPEIDKFLISDRSVKFKDGRVEKNVDCVVFCTGYMYSFPFLQSLEVPIVINGDRGHNLYQQIFYHPIPTLSFLGLPQRIVPLPVSEAQSAVVARVLSGRLALPSPKKMQIWEAGHIGERGSGKSYHMLAFPLDATYINYLHDWAMSAPRNEVLDHNGAGKIPPYWGEEKQWIRERFPLIKTASRNLGKRRHEVKTLEELGFDFQQWKLETESGNQLL